MRSETFAAIALALAFLPSARAQTDDAMLKAAYIYNIAQFTTWPAAAATRPLIICVDSGHALWQSVRQLQGKLVGDRKVAVVEPAAGTPCDVAVLRAGARRPAADGGTLAIVDEPGSGYAGAVALVEEDQHLRFDIDTAEAARAGLRFSSRLLRLARNVR
ncbi:YfiR family protein [Massilia sp. METH4]|uniref:YfiR family protein n=1 Tax=Massilia sp. METH4 TaxID=3123041 RepID=UPI0030D43016